jgi:hypothetical protein
MPATRTRRPRRGLGSDLTHRIPRLQPLRPRLLAQLRRGERSGLKLRLLAQCPGRA